MTLITVKRLEFAWQRPGDYLVTNRVALDVGGPTYRMALRWLPQAETWTLDLATSTGTTIVSGAWLRDRTDCLLGITTPGRPVGAIMPYDPKGRGDPGVNAFATEGVGLYYVPDGIDPEWFTKYPAGVV